MTLKQYRKFEKDLMTCRMEYGIGSEKELTLIETGCLIWDTLNPEQQDILTQEGSKCFPSTAFFKYKELTKQLNLIQNRNNDSSDQEEYLLDIMDVAWYNMSEEERTWMKNNYKNIC